jgi:hypothetical protein
MARPRPGRDASARLKAGASEFYLGQAVAPATRLNGSPDLSIACMMTIKLRMGAVHFLLKRLPKVRGEMALHVGTAGYFVRRPVFVTG